MQQRIAARFRPVGDSDSSEEQNGHGPPDGPAVRLRSRHASQRVRQPRADGEDRKHLDEVGQWRRILEWMSTVGVEETAAVGAVLLDDLLRSHWPLRDGLRCNRIHYRLAFGIDGRLAVGIHMLHLLRFDQLRRVVRLQVLHHSLRDQQQRADHAERQQHPQDAANHVYPEVADGLHLPPRDAANEGDRQRDAGRCGNKVVVSKTRHLGEVAHRALATIGLPVGVRGERSGRVPRQVLGRHAREFLRIERQMQLYPLDQIQQQHRHHAEQQHGRSVFRPAHLVVLVHAGQAIDQALDRPHHRIQKRPLAIEDPRHEDTQRLRDQEDQREVRSRFEATH